MFTTSLPEPDRKPGGVDVLIDRLARRLVHRGHEVRIYTYSPIPEGASYDVVRLHPEQWRRQKLRRMLSVPAALNRLAPDGLDVLHLHGDDWFYLRRPLPTVRTFYGSALDEARTATRWRRRANQLVTFGLEVVAAQLATSTYGLIPGDGRFYGSSGALGCGVDVRPVDAPRSAHPTVLFVGTWHGRKRGRDLARAFVQHVAPQVPDAELLMVSDEVEPTPGVTHVVRPTDAELRELYARSWVFCLPSAYEGFGIPYLEAMAAGTPVVATPNPGAEHLLGGGRFGTIVSLEELGGTLAALLRDEARRAELGRLGLQRAAQYSWDVVCAAHERAYADAIARWSG
jgi:phosphatidylinositol alpha-mannosyltransferase